MNLPHIVCSAGLARRLWPLAERIYSQRLVVEGMMLVVPSNEPAFWVPLDPELTKRGGARG